MLVGVSLDGGLTWQVAELDGKTAPQEGLGLCNGSTCKPPVPDRQEIEHCLNSCK